MNFAIAKRGAKAGIEHLGIQVEDEGELNEVFARLSRAEQPILEEKATTCCYAQSAPRHCLGNLSDPWADDHVRAWRGS